MRLLNKLVRGLSVVGLASAPVFGDVTLDPDLPTYTPTQGVSGSIKSVGSDTMNNVMALWLEGFRNFYPNVKPEVEGKGSSTAPPALIAGTSTFGPMSRSMKNKELDAFEAKFGYKPTQLSTAIDMLAVYVNKDNPIEGMTLSQVDAIFSKNRKLGGPNAITTWGQVGMTGQWADKPISLYGRNAASGTYGYFKKVAMGKGDYKNSVKEQGGSSAVVQSVASDKGAIGYSGIGYKTADVRAISLSAEADDEFVPAHAEYAYTGDYPLARFLYVYVNYKPGQNLDPLRREFIKYMFSKQGQETVLKDGYFPVTAEVARNALRAVGIEPTF